MATQEVDLVAIVGAPGSVYVIRCGDETELPYIEPTPGAVWPPPHDAVIVPLPARPVFGRYDARHG